jgi:hypothetical protein
LKECGYSEYEGSLATNAQYQRLYFHQNNPPFLIEIHSAPLIFHHKISFDEGLGGELLTLTLADLVITKLQWNNLADHNLKTDVVRLQEEKKELLGKARPDDNFRINQIGHLLELFTENTAQLIDLCVLFAEHPVVTGDEAQGIFLERIQSAARSDWGLWITIRRNLISLERFVQRAFTQHEHAQVTATILERTAMLRTALSTLSRTTFKWKANSVLHGMICEKCCSIGYPVEEARSDIWQNAQITEKEYGEVR